MGYAKIVIRQLRRRPVRTLSTVAALALCSFLLCTLRTVVVSVQSGLESTRSWRLVTRSALGLTSSVPATYKSKIAAVEGVTGVAVATYFLGFRGSPPDLSSYFPNLAVDEDYLGLHPEIVLPEEQRQAFEADRRGCIVGRETAERFGWKIGDTFQLESAIPPYRRPSGPFEFIVRGIYSGDDDRFPGTDQTMMLFHFKYLEEGIGQALRTKTFSVAIDQPERAGEISRAIDARFESSERPTRSETEAAFQANFASLAGNLTRLLEAVGLAAGFAMLLVTANTMAMNARERRGQVALLKTLGFSGSRLFAMTLGEGLLIGTLGGGLGIVLSGQVISTLPQVPLLGSAFSQLPGLELSFGVAALGFLAASSFGLLAGLLPAVRAYRAPITEMLRAMS